MAPGWLVIDGGLLVIFIYGEKITCEVQYKPFVQTPCMLGIPSSLSAFQAGLVTPVSLSDDHPSTFSFSYNNQLFRIFSSVKEKISRALIYQKQISLTNDR